MPLSATATTIESITAALSKRRDQDQRLVLCLGSRTGGLFRNKYLYNTLRQFSNLNFDRLSDLSKFQECYQVLRGFDDIERQAILVGALSSLTYREGEIQLAGLIKAGFFDIIISTNIDTSLEEAYKFWGMQASYDYRVIVAEQLERAEIEQNVPGHSDIVKVFGSLTTSRSHVIGNSFTLDTYPGLKHYLREKLATDVLIIGYDPVWDAALAEAFSSTGGTIWYVNEEPVDTNLPPIFKERMCNVLQGQEGNYSHFLSTMYKFLGGGIEQEETTTYFYPDQSTHQNRVFVSCSQNDKEYLNRLNIHLKGYGYSIADNQAENILDIWDDTKIRPGLEWEKEMKAALSQAKAAVLLVSPAFLGSELRSKHELPLLLEAADKGKLQLFPIILNPSNKLFDAPDKSLYQHQKVTSVSAPLNGMTPYEQEVVWAKLAEQIYELLLEPA